MQEKIGEVSNEVWELILKKFDAVVTIPVVEVSDSVILGLCGYYNKGKVEAYLISITKPNIKADESSKNAVQRAVSSEDWSVAVAKAKEIIERYAVHFNSAHGRFSSAWGRELPPSQNGGKEVI